MAVYTDKSVVVVNAKLGTVVRITEELRYFVTALAIAPNGRTVAVSTKSEEMKVTLTTRLLSSREKNAGSFGVQYISSHPRNFRK